MADLKTERPTGEYTMASQGSRDFRMKDSSMDDNSSVLSAAGSRRSLLSLDGSSRGSFLKQPIGKSEAGKSEAGKSEDEEEDERAVEDRLGRLLGLTTEPAAIQARYTKNVLYLYSSIIHSSTYNLQKGARIFFVRI